MAYTKEFPVRFDDVDFARVVYFPKLLGYCHAAFEDFFFAEMGISFAEILQKRNVGFPPVHVEADFGAPLRFGDLCRIVLETLRLGNGSITCRYQLFRLGDPKRCAQVEITHAVISTDAFSPAPLPDDLRGAFAKHLVARAAARPDDS
jgi:4-hydroxybenzoyl-CoA thioesterase